MPRGWGGSCSSRAANLQLSGSFLEYLIAVRQALRLNLVLENYYNRSQRELSRALVRILSSNGRGLVLVLVCYSENKPQNPCFANPCILKKFSKVPFLADVCDRPVCSQRRRWRCPCGDHDKGSQWAWSQGAGGHVWAGRGAGVPQHRRVPHGPGQQGPTAGGDRPSVLPIKQPTVAWRGLWLCAIPLFLGKSILLHLSAVPLLVAERSLMMPFGGSLLITAVGEKKKNQILAGISYSCKSLL